MGFDIRATSHRTGNNYFNLSEKGTITIDSIGQSIFSPSESGKHQYLTIQGEENIGQPATHL